MQSMGCGTECRVRLQCNARNFERTPPRAFVESGLAAVDRSLGTKVNPDGGDLQLFSDSHDTTAGTDNGVPVGRCAAWMQ